MNTSTDLQKFRVVPHAAILVLGLLLTLSTAMAEVPPRFYLKTLVGTNAIPVIKMDITGNANPLDPSHHISGDVSIEADILIAGYAKIFKINDRAAMLAFLAPMGDITSDTIIAGNISRQISSGFGDPIIEFNINLIGPEAIKSIPDIIRYEPGFSLDLIFDLALPVGEYDKSQSVNLGLNRWYGRIGAPIIWQFGAWVPGRRTTLEFLPSIWLFGDNNDFVGQNLETDPTFELDTHLTRDFSMHMWGSLDAIYISSGDSKINGVTTSGSDSTSLGFTFGYQINDGLQLTLGYKSTIGSADVGDLDQSSFMISIISGWHPVLSGAERLKMEH